MAEASAASGPIKRLVGRRNRSDARGQLHLHGQAVQLWQERLEQLDRRINELSSQSEDAVPAAVDQRQRSAAAVQRLTKRRSDLSRTAAALSRRDPSHPNARDVAELELA